jgi:sucrose-6-phosphate hydrolase SacC (GH32 family)
VRYVVKERTLIVGDLKVKIPLWDGRVKLRMLVDRTSIELFANDGLVYMPMSAVPKKSEPLRVKVQATGGDGAARNIEIRELESIWPAAR